MSCNANPGELQATKHGKTIKRAIKHALAALQDLGDSSCFGGGGLCPGGSCEWIVQSVQISYHFDIETEDFEATATGTGSCECV